MSLANYAAARDEALRRVDRAVLFKYFPDEDNIQEGKPPFFSRDKYFKQMEFYRWGQSIFARLFMAGNGVGKTETAGIEVALHARGWYPDWWEGIRYDRPLDIWIAGRTREDTRNFQQTKLLGKPYEEAQGKGIIPLEWIDLDSIKRISNPSGAIDTFRIKRADGGHSYIGFKSYDQKVDGFFGTEKDIIWLDEIAPFDIYSQCVARTRNRVNPRILITFTPLTGRTPLVKLFEDQPDPSRVVVKAGWASAPHLDEEYKRKQRANTLPFLLPAVEHGEAARSGGSVYPIEEKEFVVNPMMHPYQKSWYWLWGFDGGLHNTACVWVAHDRDRDVIYIVADYKDGGPAMDYSIHATRIMARCRGFGFPGMPGYGDAAATSQLDGKKTITEYNKMFRAATGRDTLHLADKAVATGISAVWERLQNGKLKVYSNCTKLLEEFRDYRFHVDEETGERGDIVKKDDHIMDAMRYAVMSIKNAKQIEETSRPVLIQTASIRR